MSFTLYLMSHTFSDFFVNIFAYLMKYLQIYRPNTLDNQKRYNMKINQQPALGLVSGISFENIAHEQWKRIGFFFPESSELYLQKIVFNTKLAGARFFFFF